MGRGRLTSFRRLLGVVGALVNSARLLCSCEVHPVISHVLLVGAIALRLGAVHHESLAVSDELLSALMI